MFCAVWVVLKTSDVLGSVRKPKILCQKLSGYEITEFKHTPLRSAGCCRDPGWMRQAPEAPPSRVHPPSAGVFPQSRGTPEVPSVSGIIRLDIASLIGCNVVSHFFARERCFGGGCAAQRRRRMCRFANARLRVFGITRPGIARRPQHISFQKD